MKSGKGGFFSKLTDFTDDTDKKKSARKNEIAAMTAHGYMGYIVSFRKKCVEGRGITCNHGSIEEGGTYGMGD